MTGMQDPTDEAGFTLVELLVVIVLLGVVSSITLSGTVSVFRAVTHAESRIEATTQLHTTVANMSKQIRSAAIPPTGATTLRVAGPSELDFDLYRDGRRHRYTYRQTAAGQLTERRRTWDDPAALPTATPQADVTRTLLRNLANTSARPLFSYVNSDGTCVAGCPMNTPDAVVAADEIGGVFEVRIRLTRDIGRDRDPIEVETSMVLRNAIQG